MSISLKLILWIPREIRYKYNKLNNILRHFCICKFYQNISVTFWISLVNVSENRFLYLCWTLKNSLKYSKRFSKDLSFSIFLIYLPILIKLAGIVQNTYFCSTTYNILSHEKNLEKSCQDETKVIRFFLVMVIAQFSEMVIFVIIVPKPVISKVLEIFRSNFQYFLLLLEILLTVSSV